MTMTGTTTGRGSRGAARAAVEELVNAGLLDELMAKVDDGDVQLTGEGGFLPEMIKAVLERGLAAELTDHLGAVPRVRLALRLDVHASTVARPGSHARSTRSPISRRSTSRRRNDPGGSGGGGRPGRALRPVRAGARGCMVGSWQTTALRG